MIHTRALLVPFALCAVGTMGLFLSGCGKQEQPKKEAVTSPHSPESYMNDPAFRQSVADKRKELQAIVAERAPLVARMEELIRSNGQDVAVLKQIPEWNDLHQKVVALNAKYDETRKRQLKLVQERIAPESNRKISK